MRNFFRLVPAIEDHPFAEYHLLFSPDSPTNPRESVPMHFSTMGHLEFDCVDVSRWAGEVEKLWCVRHIAGHFPGAPLISDYFCDLELARQFASMAKDARIYLCRENRFGYYEARQPEKY